MATYPNDATTTITSTTYSLSGRKPDRGFTYDIEYPINVFVSQSGHEKRNSVSRRPKRTYALRYTNIQGGYVQALNDFYKSVHGNLNSFYFDTAHIGQSGLVMVRFEGKLSISEVQSTLEMASSIYNVQFNFVETYS
jgi:hypothetical protein